MKRCVHLLFYLCLVFGLGVSFLHLSVHPVSAQPCIPAACTVFTSPDFYHCVCSRNPTPVPPTPNPPQPTAAPSDPQATQPPGQNDPPPVYNGNWEDPVCGNTVFQGGEDCESISGQPQWPWEVYYRLNPTEICQTCKRVVSPTQCADGLDNDQDGNIDCRAANPDPACFPDGHGGGGNCNPYKTTEVDDGGIPAPVVVAQCDTGDTVPTLSVSWGPAPGNSFVSIAVDNNDNTSDGYWYTPFYSIGSVLPKKIVPSTLSPYPLTLGPLIITNGAAGPYRVFATYRYFAGFSLITTVSNFPNCVNPPLPTEPPPIGGNGLAMCGQGCINSFECQANYACVGGSCQLAICQDSNVVCQSGNCGMICPGITMSPGNPKVGDLVQFTCTAVPGAVYYDFQIIDPNGSIREISSDTNFSPLVPIVQSGHHDVQCRICTGLTPDTCQEFALLQ